MTAEPASNVNEPVYVKVPSTTIGYRNVACSRCGQALEPVFAENCDPDGTWVALQPQGALVITLEGGYGMAIDPIGDRPGPAILCEPCLPEVLEANPWLAAVLDDYRSPRHVE